MFFFFFLDSQCGCTGFKNRFEEVVNLDILVLMVLLPNTVWKWKNGLEV